MSRKTRQDDGRKKKLWRTKTDLCGVWDCSPTYFDRELRPLLDECDVKRPEKRGQPILYRARALLDAWLERQVETRMRRAVPSDDDNGVDSPNLEEYRKWRAVRERLAVEREARQVVDRSEMRQGLGMIAAVIRHAGDTMQRQGHAEAYQILDEALDEAERLIADMFADPVEGSR